MSTFQLPAGVLTDVRLDVREAMDNRSRMLIALGYVLKGGEWLDAKSKDPITMQEIQEINRIGDQSIPRKAHDARWPWPSTYVPF